MFDKENQKQRIMELVVREREKWERENSILAASQTLPSPEDYKTLMRNFLIYFRDEALPQERRSSKSYAKISEKTVLVALKEYCRADWIAKGYNLEQFDRELRQTKQSYQIKKILSSIWFVVSIFTIIALKVFAKEMPNEWFWATVIGLAVIYFAFKLMPWNRESENESISLTK